MQPSKIVKALAIALPILTLAACGSTQDAEQQVEETNQAQQTEQVETPANVEVSKLEKEKELQMLERQKQQDMLRQNAVIRFEFDQARIGSEYFEILEAHASFLRDNPEAKVVVEGHTDERGTPEYNIALGERRAKAVVKYLQNLGVSASQISQVSYGEEKPENTSRTEAAFAANRRAVLVY
ncbi:peptidoglycan-associated lipoprotein Pal [Catenovulum sp. SM1970]|uniref:peptidoglycan-associated lipoprotein Pal n=1 Tax=Marinifaba aquimaris TaxID=2741323 RepID=UPI0015733D41|nr:peptidoglycan-associated lipoprotein Pal [Marinifaba aquimaris]NTS78130.1 peptidoglycan-associated lipoprotein Pal [Marinifaba aquimaris]